MNMDNNKLKDVLNLETFNAKFKPICRWWRHPNLSFFSELDTVKVVNCFFFFF